VYWEKPQLKHHTSASPKNKVQSWGGGLDYKLFLGIAESTFFSVKNFVLIKTACRSIELFGFKLLLIVP